MRFERAQLRIGPLLSVRCAPLASLSAVWHERTRRSALPWFQHSTIELIELPQNNHFLLDSRLQG